MSRLMVILTAVTVPIWLALQLCSQIFANAAYLLVR